MSDEITVQALAEVRASGQPHVVLDVREHDEVATAALDGALHIPMNEIPERFGELPADCEIAVLCHSGRRSAVVTRFLRANGYGRAVNVRGGIDAWSVHVDPTVPRY